MDFESMDKNEAREFRELNMGVKKSIRGIRDRLMGVSGSKRYEYSKEKDMMVSSADGEYVKYAYLIGIQNKALKELEEYAKNEARKKKLDDDMYNSEENLKEEVQRLNILVSSLELAALSKGKSRRSNNKHAKRIGI